MDGLKRSCGHCGNPVAGRLFVREGDRYCCEACYLRRGDYAGAENVHSLLAEALAAALDLREHETGLHSKRVACHTQVLARRFSADPDELQQVYWGALLHDLGKIGVRDGVLLKQGPLTEDEWPEMRTHPRHGYDILAPLPHMAHAATIVLTHEERFDGGGYPQGLRGDEIPLGARLFALIDTLDAITSDRPYRRGAGFDDAAREIVRCAGRQFDPLAVDAFIAEEPALRRMVALKCAMEANPLTWSHGLVPAP